MGESFFLKDENICYSISYSTGGAFKRLRRVWMRGPLEPDLDHASEGKWKPYSFIPKEFSAAALSIREAALFSL